MEEPRLFFINNWVDVYRCFLIVLTLFSMYQLIRRRPGVEHVFCLRSRVLRTVIFLWLLQTTYGLIEGNILDVEFGPRLVTLPFLLVATAILVTKEERIGRTYA